jgi:cell division protease FtsH
MVECDKELTPYFYKCLRDRLKADNMQCIYLDGRPPSDVDPQRLPPTMVGILLMQLKDLVRGAVGERIVVLPHLDLLTTSNTGLTSEAREVIALLYENPQVMWVGFKDPSFALPKVITNLFAHRESILGLSRNRLASLVTQRESRKFGKELRPYQLYKYVSGVNAVRLRRLLQSLEGEDYPTSPEATLKQLRGATLGGQLSLPNLDLHKDIGGYDRVKKRLQTEILDILHRKDGLEDEAEVQRLEALIPRGMIFEGPPGTGKTLFAKAMATALGAAVSVVSGPELKSRWVGESEERIRQVFVKARQSAPSVIIFDELDSFATARGTYSGSGVEHSMVNQLLTEMDGFRSDELVFVVGTTNFVESLDPALLRPGRFEFHLEIPYPNSEDRRAIFEIYNKNLRLELSERALTYAVKRSGEHVPTTGSHYSGDHIQALCRAIARRRVREAKTGPTELEDIDTVLNEYLDLPELTSAEERVVATHEAGHAVCAMHCEHVPPIDRVSIRGDVAGALGVVRYSDPAHKYVVTRAELLDSLCVLYGGREAEALLCEDISIGASHDISRATNIAQSLVQTYGMGDPSVGSRAFVVARDELPIAEETRKRIDDNIRQVLEKEQERARALLKEHKAELEALRDLLLERKVLDSESLQQLGGKN